MLNVSINKSVLKTDKKKTIKEIIIKKSTKPNLENGCIEIADSVTDEQIKDIRLTD